MCVVQEPVEHGGGDCLVGHLLRPFRKGLVRRHHDRSGLVAGIYELEEHVGLLWGKRLIADGVEIGGVASYLDASDSSNLNLFVKEGTLQPRKSRPVAGCIPLSAATYRGRQGPLLVFHSTLRIESPAS